MVNLPRASGNLASPQPLGKTGRKTVVNLPGSPRPSGGLPQVFLGLPPAVWGLPGRFSAPGKTGVDRGRLGKTFPRSSPGCNKSAAIAGEMLYQSSS